MRTRSQPLSPGGYQSLDDKPSRRRATRSASSAEPTTESQPADMPRKTRAKKGTVTRKTTRSKSKVVKPDASDLQQTSPAATAQSKAPTADEQDMQSDGQMSPSITAPSRQPLTNLANSRVLGPLQATPIMRRRPRIPYSTITARRRTNADGRVVNTLFQLPDLISQSPITVPAPVDRPVPIEQEANAITRVSVTPEPTLPTTPKTAPAASAGHSPSWPRRIIANVSSKWLNIRGRFSPRKSLGSQDTFAEASAASPSATAPSTPQIEDMKVSTQTPFSTEMELVTMDSPSVTRAATTTTRRPSYTRPRIDGPKRPSVVDYSIRGKLSQETLDRCYARSRPLPLPGTEAPEQPASEQVKKRKRSSPESIPNPPGCSYGMHDDYFTFDSDDEIWAEEEKAALAREAAKAPKATESESEGAAKPPLKKQRVAEEPDQKRHRHVLHPNTPRKADKRAGYNPNRQSRLYQATDLSTIESSGLFSEGEQGPQATQTRPETKTTPKNPQGTFCVPGYESGSDSEDYPSSGPVPQFTSTPNGMYLNLPSSLDDKSPGPSPAPRIILHPNPHGTFQTPYSSSDSSSSDEDGDEKMDLAPAPRIILHPKPHGTFQTPYSSSDEDEDEEMHLLPNMARADSMDEDTTTPARTPNVPTETTTNTTTNTPNNTTAKTTTETNPKTNDAPKPSDLSPLTRIRNKAQQFKPKTPSRLREASRFSTGSTDLSPMSSDPMSLDGSSYIDILQDSEDLESIDHAWLQKNCPSGQLNKLSWPGLSSIAEIGIPAGLNNLDEIKTKQAVEYWHQCFLSEDW
ncbi:hypothetical protein N7520_007632 [Penicillium odoratum]|uniref:uncharacterized protein n=1 Tax=Penicillium odoratum TaxID=1167516 RepID=UPI002546D6F6|nr:uncharacterized protein N7520_007632 [Penicillium odoratum]KAJ5760476.1 hypothetical protein N7520_007632 [Penicillium odoratum]